MKDNGGHSFTEGSEEQFLHANANQFGEYDVPSDPHKTASYKSVPKEGSEPIKLTDEQRIIMDAAKYSRFNNNHDVVEGAEYRGYIAGANAERERMESLKSLLSTVHKSLCTYGEHPLIDEWVKRALVGNFSIDEQLKEERNKAIEDCVQIVQGMPGVFIRYDYWHDLLEAFKILKDKPDQITPIDCSECKTLKALLIKILNPVNTLNEWQDLKSQADKFLRKSLKSDSK